MAEGGPSATRMLEATAAAAMETAADGREKGILLRVFFFGGLASFQSTAYISGLVVWV